MPPVSQAQRAAMFAAKSGHSTLGIPKSVGADFANADPGGKLPAKVSNGQPVKAFRPSSSVEAMTGMARGGKKKVRRGGGRHKSALKSHEQHVQDLQKHLASGDHASAKSSALNLAKLLHGMSAKKQVVKAPTPPENSASQPGVSPSGAPVSTGFDPALLG